MRKILLLGAALGAAAMVATAAFAADPVETPFPSQAVGDLFIAAQTVDGGRRDEQLLRAGQHRRLPRVRRRRQDAQGRSRRPT